MDPYWLFLKTVLNTVLSLFSAAAVLFTGGPAPDAALRPRAGVVLASFSTRPSAALQRTPQSDTGSTNAAVIEALTGALKDSDTGVRRHAAIALGEIGDARAVSALIAALADKDREVRRAVVTALGEIGDSTAIEPLTRAMKDEDPEVRRRAIIAIAELSDGHGRDSWVHPSPRPNPNPNPNPRPRPRPRPAGV
jgi:HEAT repeat protein